MKKTSDTASHDVKTVGLHPHTCFIGLTVSQGTAEFMAVEVHLQTYLFLPIPCALDKRSLVAVLRSKKPIPEFRFNPLHDLESIWWIALWTFLRFTLADVSGTQLMRQYRIARTSFPGIAVDRDRNECFRSPNAFQVHLDNLAFGPDTTMGKLGFGVDVLAFALRQEYAEVEEFPIQVEKFNGVHDRFNDAMDELVTSMSEQVNNVMLLYDLVNQKLTAKRKSWDDDTNTVQAEASGRKKPRK